MNYLVKVHHRTIIDVYATLDWLAANSNSGPQRWYDSYLEALDSLEKNPLNCGFAIESEFLSVPIREKFFGTSKRQKYRLIYLIEGHQVHVLRLRGPGQDYLKSEDIE